MILIESTTLFEFEMRHEDGSCTSGNMSHFKLKSVMPFI